MDLAIECGEIVVTKDDPVDCVLAVQLSKKVMLRIKQNIVWVFTIGSYGLI